MRRVFWTTVVRLAQLPMEIMACLQLTVLRMLLGSCINVFAMDAGPHPLSATPRRDMIVPELNF